MKKKLINVERSTQERSSLKLEYTVWKVKFVITDIICLHNNSEFIIRTIITCSTETILYFKPTAGISSSPKQNIIFPF